jgi:hypothetical protein
MIASLSVTLISGLERYSGGIYGNTEAPWRDDSIPFTDPGRGFRYGLNNAWSSFFLKEMRGEGLEAKSKRSEEE